MEMRPRKFGIRLTYNGADAADEITADLLDFSYSDALEESDSASITLKDDRGRWAGAWTPRTGDRIDPVICLENWGKDRISELNCGELLLDTFSLSGYPGKLQLEAVSAPADTAFTETKRSQTWESVTICQVAGEIASRYGLECVYDADEITIKRMEQNKRPDSEFLKELCSRYGLILKIYNRRLIVFSYENYEKREPSGIITPQTPGLSWTYKSTVHGTYTGARISYTPPKKRKTVEITVGSEERLYYSNEKAESEADAERLGLAAMRMANRKGTVMTVRMMPDLKYVSGSVLMVSGFGKPDGKYLVNKATHSMSSSQYMMNLTLFKIQEGENA